MTTNTQIQFPQVPFVDMTSGRVNIEWMLWLQNPQFITVNLGTVLAVASGGTGIGSYVVGDILFASATDELDTLADVATGNALLSGGVGAAPAWGKVGLTTHVSGTLGIANGGTGNTTGTATINANLTGPITSTGNATAVASQTGTGSTFVMSAVPSFATTAGVGAATAAASGAGITFPATQSASSDVNTLDDYEEGTWTPALTFATPGDLSVAYTTQKGFYTKIGNVVVIQFNVVTSTFTFTTASGNLEITGLPFAQSSATGSISRGATSWGGITKAGYTQVSASIASSASLITFNASGSGVAISAVTATDTPTAGTIQLIGTMTYRTDT